MVIGRVTGEWGLDETLRTVMPSNTCGGLIVTLQSASWTQGLGDHLLFHLVTSMRVGTMILFTATSLVPSTGMTHGGNLIHGCPINKQRGRWGHTTEEEGRRKEIPQLDTSRLN